MSDKRQQRKLTGGGLKVGWQPEQNENAVVELQVDKRHQHRAGTAIADKSMQLTQLPSRGEVS
jgi:hypothetical protein